MSTGGGSKCSRGKGMRRASEMAWRQGRAALMISGPTPTLRMTPMGRDCGVAFMQKTRYKKPMRLICGPTGGGGGFRSIRAGWAKIKANEKWKDRVGTTDMFDLVQ